MHLSLTRDPFDTLIVILRDGDVETTVSARPSSAALRSLSGVVDDAGRDGYGECFWPGADGGQYWWIVKRDESAAEVVVMWTRGGVAIWEHVFRATDAFSWIRDHLDREMARIAPTA
jgi:hypothetical protein